MTKDHRQLRSRLREVMKENQRRLLSTEHPNPALGTTGLTLMDHYRFVLETGGPITTKNAISEIKNLGRV